MSKKKDKTNSILAVLIIFLILAALTVVSVWSAKGFCIATQDSSILGYIWHASLQASTGGPLGLYGVYKYLQSDTPWIKILPF